MYPGFDEVHLDKEHLFYVGPAAFHWAGTWSTFF